MTIGLSMLRIGQGADWFNFVVMNLFCFYNYVLSMSLLKDQ